MFAGGTAGRRATACALLAMAAGGVGAPHAVAADRGAWGREETVAAKGVNPAVSVDARGGLLASWAEMGQPGESWFYKYKRRSPAGSWGAALELEVAGATKVAPPVMNASGRAAVGWLTRDDRVAVAVADPGGRFGRPRFLTRTTDFSGSAPMIAIDDEGNLIAAWTRRETMNGASAVQFATARAGEPFTAATTLTTETSGGPIRIEVNPAGAAAIAWSTSRAQVQVSYRPPGGSFGSPEQLEGWSITPAIELNPSGELFEAAAPFNGRDAYAGTIVSARSPLGGWSAPSTVFFGGNANRMSAPQLLPQPDGSVSLIIEDPVGDVGGNKLFFATRRPDGTTTTPTVVSSPDAGSADAAGNLRGDILAMWSRHFRHVGTDGNDAEVVIAERDRDEPLSGEMLLAPHALNGKVALNEAGQAAAIYGRVDDQGQMAGIGVRVREGRSAQLLPFPPAVSVARQADRSLGRDGSLSVAPRCDTSCRIDATGVLYPGGRGIRGKATAVRLAKSRRGRLVLRFGVPGARAARRALARGRRPWISVSVIARGKSPQSRTVSRAVKLKR